MTDKGHILIVDDDKDFAETIKFRLEKLSYRVSAAYDGEEAVRKAKGLRPDLVLLDIKIPGMDGLEVLKTVTEADPELYVVMITGNASLESAIEALRYGAHDYILKPLEEGRLETVVKRCLDKVRLSRELKEAQDRLLAQSQKLAAIGQLAAGIAHEISNPLTGIRGTVQLLLDKKRGKELDEKDLKTIEKETGRCQEILKRLLGFARLPEPEILPVNVNKVIEDAFLLLAPEASLKKVKLIKEFDSHLPPVPGVANQLEQVFLNLILNAFQAMPDGGNLTISTSLIRKPHPVNRSETDFIEISFEDTGCGISKEYLKHLFDPFFTTKKMTDGTGLGLAVSYGIIHKHHGTIEVESEVGKGTAVMVELPIAD